MATLKQFEDLDAWKEARELTQAIYRITSVGEFAHDYGLRDQIRRAAISIMSNIAEGFERGGDKEFLQFLSIAKGSCGEIRAQLYAALDQAYVSEVQFQNLVLSARNTERVCNEQRPDIRQSFPLLPNGADSRNARPSAQVCDHPDAGARGAIATTQYLLHGSVRHRAAGADPLAGAPPSTVAECYHRTASGVQCEHGQALAATLADHRHVV